MKTLKIIITPYWEFLLINFWVEQKKKKNNPTYRPIFFQTDYSKYNIFFFLALAINTRSIVNKEMKGPVQSSRPRHDKTNKMSVCPAKTQSLGICPVWSVLCAQWVAKDPRFLHADSEDWLDWVDAQADLSLRWAHTHFVGFVMSRLKWNCYSNPPCQSQSLDQVFDWQKLCMKKIFEPCKYN